ncbi:MAG: hypothetical protein JWN71_2888 [Xanthobacteraceae bacterium]|jgi:hypothetical protein|nr:hypothetical protein [Xanthobacteraceae bacterium]
MMLQAVLLPVFVMVALTFGLLFYMGNVRVGTLKRGEVKVRDVALRQPNWPERATKASMAYHNQLELPLLFYVLVILALFTKQADLLFVLLSWVFVTLRVLHALIIVTSNRIQHRFGVFAASVLVLLIMWIIFAIRILTAI